MKLLGRVCTLISLTLTPPPLPQPALPQPPPHRRPTHRPLPRSARTRRCTLCHEHELAEAAVVEYADPSTRRLRLGVYTAQMLGAPPHIQPLAAASEDEGAAALLWDEAAPPVPLDAVVRVLDPEFVLVSERQMGGGQGLGNPHGEHGEDCFDVSDIELSDGVLIPVRDESRLL